MIVASDEDRAEHYAREQMGILRQLGRVATEHGRWDVLARELEGAFATGVKAGRASWPTAQATRAVMEAARDYGEGRCLVVRAQSPGLDVDGTYWALLSDQAKSAWYIGYYAGRGYHR